MLNLKIYSIFEFFKLKNGRVKLLNLQLLTLKQSKCNFNRLTYRKYQNC